MALPNVGNLSSLAKDGSNGQKEDAKLQIFPVSKADIWSLTSTNIIWKGWDLYRGGGFYPTKTERHHVYSKRLHLNICWHFCYHSFWNGSVLVRHLIRLKGVLAKEWSFISRSCACSPPGGLVNLDTRRKWQWHGDLYLDTRIWNGKKRNLKHCPTKTSLWCHCEYLILFKSCPFKSSWFILVKWGVVLFIYIYSSIGIQLESFSRTSDLLSNEILLLMKPSKSMLAMLFLSSSCFMDF